MDETWAYDMNGEPMVLVDWAPAYADFEGRCIGKAAIGGTEVSTVWTGLPSNWVDEGPRLIFETMVSGGQHDAYTERYSTKEEAGAGHDRIVGNLQAGRAPEEAKEDV